MPKTPYLVAGNANRTYAFYTQKLLIDMDTAKRYGKKKCETLYQAWLLTYKQAPVSHAKTMPAEQVKKPVKKPLPTGEKLDKVTQNRASVLLHNSIDFLEKFLDNPDIPDYQKAQIALKATSVIASAKGG